MVLYLAWQRTSDGMPNLFGDEISSFPRITKCIRTACVLQLSIENPTPISTKQQAARCWCPTNPTFKHNVARSHYLQIHIPKSRPNVLPSILVGEPTGSSRNGYDGRTGPYQLPPRVCRLTPPPPCPPPTLSVRGYTTRVIT